MGRSPIDEERPPRLEDLERAFDDERRFVDICIQFAQHLDSDPKGKASGPVILTVGGRFNRDDEEYVGEPETARIWPVNPSQLEGALWMADWFERRRRGEPKLDRVVVFGGPRRGGKTDLGTKFVIAVAVEVPNAVTWLISRTYKERDELDRLIKRWVPRSWWTYKGSPEFRYTLKNGSTIEHITADDPEGLKRGGAHAFAVNEGQKMDGDVVELAIPAVVDQAGIGVIMANPPSSRKRSAEGYRGEWLVELRKHLMKRQLAGRYFEIDPAKNPSIDQAARSDVAQILHVMNPRRAAADAEGIWGYLGDLTYRAFLAEAAAFNLDGTLDPNVGHIGQPPDIAPRGWLDVTAEITKKLTGRAWSSLAAADFQRKDCGCALLEARLLRAPDGALVYHPIREILGPPTEEELSDTMYDAGLDPAQLLIIADSSGAWQKNTRIRDGQYSHTILRERGWGGVVPVARPVNAKGSPSGAGRNPLLLHSIPQVHNVLVHGRVLVHPACVWLIESLQKCGVKYSAGKVELDASGDRRQYTHITDCLRYLIWWAEPRVDDKPFTYTFRREILPRRV